MTTQEEIIKLIRELLQELCVKHNFTLQEAEVLLTDHCLLVNPFVTANITVDHTLLHGGLINSAALIGLKEFLGLFEKVRALEGVVNDIHVCTLLLEAMMTMEPIGNET